MGACQHQIYGLYHEQPGSTMFDAIDPPGIERLADGWLD